MSNNYVPAFWYSSNNFGDSLTHYLIKNISGKTPVLVEKNDPCDKFMVTGSILNNDVVNATVWGCGVAWANDIIPAKKKIIAVRGKLTGYLCNAQEIPHENIFGDPCLILPKLFPMAKNPKYKLGIFPHYVDTKIVYDSLGLSDYQLAEHGIKIIDVNDTVENVVSQVVQCEKIIASSLHALIVAHAYGVPAEWVQFSNKIVGDGFKYMDYYSCTDVVDPRCINLEGAFDFERVKKFLTHQMIMPNITVDLNLLYDSCPFKN
jgi:hypothetical protein